jgi:multidrug resistance efflux pump
MQCFFTSRRLRDCRRGRVRTYVIATLVVAACVGAGVWYFLGNRRGDNLSDPLTTKVIQASFEQSVIEQGEVESSDKVEIKSSVKSRNTSGMQLLWVIPEGTIVKEGDVLVKLDSSGLEQERDSQKIACNTSLAIKVQAENTYQAAVIARTEYLEGTYLQEKQTIQSEIFIAEETLRRAEQYAKFSERLATKGYVTPLQLEADRFAVDKAKNELDLAQRKLFVLENYTREKTLRTLEADIASAKAKWDAEEESYKLELKKLDEVELQVEHCTIQAPQDGQVVYANVTSSRGEREFLVEPGSMVREGQTILQMPDSKNMQVRAKINESRITNVKVGQPVTIRIDALGDLKLAGRVTRVSTFAEPSSWFASSVKQYATEIAILNPPPTIRTGLTAEVNIHVEQVPEALQVPVQSVIEHAGKTYCLLQDGLKWEPQEIKIASTNDKFIRIASGLQLGQTVAANPRQHLDRFSFIKNGILEPNPITAFPAQQAANNSGGPAGPPGAPASGGPAEKPPETGPRRGGGSPQEMFSRLDSDGNGKLSAAEWGAIPAAFRDRLGTADANGDGDIDQGELAAAFGRLRASAGGPPAGGGAPNSPRGAGE